MNTFYPPRIPKIISTIIHIGGWIGFLIINIISAPDFRNKDNSEILVQAIFTFEIAVFFYVNYLILIPKLLTRKKFLIYTGIILVMIILFSSVSELNFLISDNHSFGNKGFNDSSIPPPPPPDFDRPHHGPMEFGFFTPGFNPFRGVFVYFMVFIISTGIKMTAEWYKNERKKDLIEKEKLSNELAYLKSQINPHFLFNVLNNICSLARKKSDETETAIIKLSQLLRYNLYEMDDDKMPLSKEIQYLNDYIDIQRMRLSDNVNIVFKYSGDIENIMIEPLIFIPFVENAFKHGINTTENINIEILIEANHDSVHFSVTNPVRKNKTNSESTKGIGLTNALRRLNLLYPKRFHIAITENGSEYNVDLKIVLND